MNQSQTFNHELFGELKVTIIERKELFDLNNVAWSLGYIKVANGTEYLRHERINSIIEKLDITTFVHGGQKYIDESGLYDFIFESGTSRARDFRKWVTSEVIPSIRKTGSYGIDTTQLSPELQMMNQMFQAVAKNELETKEAKKLAMQASKKAENISNLVTLTSDDWRDKVNSILKKIARNWTGVEPYRSVKNLSYERLEKRAKCKLNIRLNNRKERALAQGMSKAYVQRINKLDCIAGEQRLVEIYLQVVKEMAIQFNVDINDFEEVI